MLGNVKAIWITTRQRHMKLSKLQQNLSNYISSVVTKYNCHSRNFQTIEMQVSLRNLERAGHSTSKYQPVQLWLTFSGKSWSLWIRLTTGSPSIWALNTYLTTYRWGQDTVVRDTWDVCSDLTSSTNELTWYLSFADRKILRHQLLSCV